ncbi:MAG: hypothetical protein II821_04355 [Treponema sp.]|nr:hypothetical protein [Treponema sp.]
MRDTVLPKTRKTVEYDGNSVLIYFVVDTSSVEKNQIAVVADAAKLKDVNGNYLLNGNLNLTAGEEGDSFIEYIGVAKNKDGTSTTPLSGDDEVFDPLFGNFLAIFIPAYWEGPYIDDGKQVLKRHCDELYL